MGRERHAGIERRQEKTTSRNRATPPVQRVEAPGPPLAAIPSPDALLAFQRTVGNAAVNQLLRGHTPGALVQRMVIPAAPGPIVQREAEDEVVQAMPAAQVMAQLAQHAATEPVPLQRWAGAATTHATPARIQRVWNFNNPAWGATQSISTLSSGQPVFFLHDAANDTIVVKGEDTPIGLTILNAGIHQQIHGARSVRTKDVTGAKATIMGLLNDPAKTSDASWTALGNSQYGQLGWVTADLANQGLVGAAATPEIRARYLQQQQLPTLPKVHAMDLVPGHTAKNLSDPNKIVGIMAGGAQAMRSLVMDGAHLRQLGMVTAADLFLENPDRVMSANFGNWFVAATGAITLIDNLDANAKGMWRDGTGLGTDVQLRMLAKGALQGTAGDAADQLVQGMKSAGDATVDAWALQPYGNGTRKQFIAEQFRAGLVQGRERIIGLYAKKPGLFASKDTKKLRKLTKRGVKAMQAQDTATGDWQAGHSKYWERLKARARWLKAN